jgi:dTDP-4-dehydrorhamnose reductase
MKLLVTGSNGFVGGAILAQAGPHWELHGMARNVLPLAPSHIRHHQLDLLDAASFSRLFKEIGPDIVIHTAAIANIDFCQTNQTLAKAVNVGITQTIAALCGDAGIRLIHCSTDTVFDGIKGNYVEEDPPNPVNFYAETKLESEEIVRSASSKNVIARLALVMGLRKSEKGNSFLSDLIGKLDNHEQVKFAENEIRTPVDVKTLSDSLLELGEMSEFSGIIHLSGNTRINRYEMARQIAIAMNFSAELIIPVNSNAFPDRANRPDDVSLVNAKARRLLKTPMLSMQEGLAFIMNQKNGGQV